MAGFATYALLRAAVDAGQILTASFYQQGDSGGGAGWIGTWYGAGNLTRPAVGVDPATTPGTAYSSTAGGIVFPDTGTNRKFLIHALIRAVQTNVAAVRLFDRLVGVGGIAVNSTGDKTVNSTALTRYTSGEGVEVYLEVDFAGTTPAPIVSLASYTNQAGTSGRVGATITFPGTTYPINGLVGPMPLQAGDTGVRSVETVNVATAGGGSGVVNVVLMKPLVLMPLMSLEGTQRNPNERTWPFPFAGLPRIYDGATLMWAHRGTSGTGAVIDGSLTVVEG